MLRCSSFSFRLQAGPARQRSLRMLVRPAAGMSAAVLSCKRGGRRRVAAVVCAVGAGCAAIVSCAHAEEAGPPLVLSPAQREAICAVVGEAVPGLRSLPEPLRLMVCQKALDQLLTPLLDALGPAVADFAAAHPDVDVAALLSEDGGGGDAGKDLKSMLASKVASSVRIPLVTEATKTAVIDGLLTAVLTYTVPGYGLSLVAAAASDAVVGDGRRVRAGLATTAALLDPGQRKKLAKSINW